MLERSCVALRKSGLPASQCYTLEVSKRPLPPPKRQTTISRVTPSPIKVPPPPRPRTAEPDPEIQVRDSDRPTAFFDEAPTARKNQTIAVYQSLLSVFDELTQAQRLELTELIYHYKDLPPEGRQQLLELAKRLSHR